MAVAIDLTGKRFGLWTVIERAQTKSPYVMWRCKCDCGKESIVRANSLRSGGSKSCGCLTAKVNAIAHTKHGFYGTRIYRIWDDMKARCYNPNAVSYPNYGGKGIAICKEWKEFIPFYEWAIQNGYKNNLTIDRLDNSKDYSPNNCRWVDMKTQANNRSTNHLVNYNGETLNLSQWATKLKFPYGLLVQRISRGWTFERAIQTPKHEYKRKV